MKIDWMNDWKIWEILIWERERERGSIFVENNTTYIHRYLQNKNLQRNKKNGHTYKHKINVSK